MSIELVMLSNHLILCCPLLLPSVFPSIRVFSNESVPRIRWPKYWSFNFSISPSNEYSGLISFRIDWFYLLAVQRTLKSLLQHHSSSQLPNYCHRTVYNILFLSCLLAVFYWLAVSQLCSGSDYIRTPTTTTASDCLPFYSRGSYRVGWPGIVHQYCDRCLFYGFVLAPLTGPNIIRPGLPFQDGLICGSWERLVEKTSRCGFVI